LMSDNDEKDAAETGDFLPEPAGRRKTFGRSNPGIDDQKQRRTCMTLEASSASDSSHHLHLNDTNTAATTTTVMAAVRRAEEGRYGRGDDDQIAGAVRAKDTPIQLRILHPGENDILLGRGKATINYVGNRRFRDLIRTRKAEYAACTRTYTKEVIAREIMDEITVNRGGRFLESVTERVTAPDLMIQTTTDEDEDNDEEHKASSNKPRSVWIEADVGKVLVKIKQSLRDREYVRPSLSSTIASAANNKLGRGRGTAPGKTTGSSSMILNLQMQQNGRHGAAATLVHKDKQDASSSSSSSSSLSSSRNHGPTQSFHRSGGSPPPAPPEDVASTSMMHIHQDQQQLRILQQLHDLQQRRLAIVQMQMREAVLQHQPAPPPSHHGSAMTYPPLVAASSSPSLFLGRSNQSYLPAELLLSLSRLQQQQQQQQQVYNPSRLVPDVVAGVAAGGPPSTQSMVNHPQAVVMPTEFASRTRMPTAIETGGGGRGLPPPPPSRDAGVQWLSQLLSLQQQQHRSQQGAHLSPFDTTAPPAVPSYDRPWP
jgi:hypothetical protein